MIMRSYGAAYYTETDNNQYGEPDLFLVHGKSFTRPAPDFVISRSNIGDVISVYGDDAWDLRSYGLAVNLNQGTLIFSTISDKRRDEAKWILFVLMYFSDAGRASALSVSTLVNYLKLIRNVDAFFGGRDIGYSDFFSSENLMAEYLSATKRNHLVAKLITIYGKISSLPSYLTGFKCHKGCMDVLDLYKSSFDRNNLQVPVIPPRILSNLINSLDKLLTDVFYNLDRLELFLVAILNDDNLGRCESYQRQNGRNAQTFEPFFEEIIELYGLQVFMNKYGVTNIPSLRSFLIKAQHGCALMMLIYSGMRKSELLSLKINSLRTSESNGKKTLRLCGFTSKLVGQKKAVSWITSEDILNAYSVANKLACLTGEKIGLTQNEIPLFISLAYLPISTSIRYDGVNVNVHGFANKSMEVFGVLEPDKFSISPDDIKFLDKIDPFRAWSQEKAFSVDEYWRFTAHQFRRSLAYYVAQSGLVSLPSLKRQLKHIGKEMTLYYCNSSALSEEFSTTEHVADLIQNTKPEADAIAYIECVYNSDEKVYGSHGNYVERHLSNDLSEGMAVEVIDRSELVKRFKNGLISYKETPLGACTKVGPCRERAIRSFAACTVCDRSVIKLSRLDRVIDKQASFVQSLESNYPDNVACRIERDELETLKKYRRRIIAKGG
ncbi:hypothetical protein ACPF3V_003332 [Vibrio cholerae]|uniref:Integrase n=2 Tax=Vibrio TaxID=662 RepID=A0A6B3LFJ5_VIBCL|nr:MULTISPECIES: hypothetical protein [Vibrio]EGQ9206777.1 hypothetical protein [Vibrio cholerae]EGQ9333803.1 hypothetical protein [Vibrio cholerae]EGQ9395949.1 hypothetical protein [Vibrio cholerae]EIA3092935.1 hypothetical protein [Vibrio cholerae]EJF0911978.1 hypothetical protein [Vibrio cholerae]